MLGGVVEGGMRIGGLAFAADRHAAPRMQVDVAGKETARLAEGDVRLHRLVEILMGNAVHLIGDMDAQCVRQFDLFS